MLNIVNKSPFQSTSLDTCLRMAQPGQGLLLIEDAIYAATKGSTAEAAIRAACSTLKVYALQPDMDARGVTAKAIEGVTLVDYSGFVDLVAQYSTSNSWL